MGKSWCSIIFVLLTGCMTVYPFSYSTNCRNEAAFCALVANEKNESRIAVGQNPIGFLHAQAKVKIDGKWVWLRMYGNYCYETEKDNFKDLTDFSVKDFVGHYLIEKKGLMRVH